MAKADKLMFEIYREAGYDRFYRVVYFTELDEHNKEQEIARAMSGEHLFDGFLRERSASEAKTVIGGIVRRLNHGDSVDADQVGRLLSPFLAD
jgi:hypothetical protein